ncbi:MAG: PSD1 and planctomycete cytochrome C domain-containing protein [Planctomycetota bacterium]|nr:PSD1 and planctomycete cytochrome C domain-containing protein [Planctomycetota bacterium]
MCIKLPLVSAIAYFLGLFVGNASLLAQQASNEVVDFVQDVKPILAKHCYACHGPDESEGGLNLSTKSTAFAETDSGSHAIVPSDPAASEMLVRVTSNDEFDQMPPEGERLTPSQVEVLRQWIQQGATWDEHWAFKPMQVIPVPEVNDQEWAKHPIDAFIYSSLDSAGLRPNPPAKRQDLLRRAFYDLTGLPPSAQLIKEFSEDPSSESFAKHVEGLLASPHYGERWGRHWLDLVRYAETNSYERDGPKPNAWKYRDYVIRSFNEDKPYDRFVAEQLAGDELDQVTKETLTATGYYRLGIWDDEPADPKLAIYDELDDILTTTSQVMLGLTINCARCHDHKIDPIPQKDYYSLLSMFADVTSWGSRGDQRSNNQIDVSSDELNERYRSNDEAKRKIDSEIREMEQAGIATMSAPDQRATEGPRKQREDVLKAKLKDHLSEEQWTAYQGLKSEQKRIEQEARSLPPREMVMGLARTQEPKQMFVLQRGSPHVPGEPVDPDFPEIFNSESLELTSLKPSEKSSGRRRALAEWITSKNNLLAARVAVNRIWQFHFGRGIVRSANNFGQLGTPPTHPELLDWLALRFIETGWSFKEMHRFIMSSRTYQMSSSIQEAAAAVDPNNDLFWKFDSRRLSAEEIRDSILLTNGSLNSNPYGPSFYPQLSREVLAGQSRPGSGWGQSNEADQNRRSVYIHVKRSLLTPLLTAFDFPDPDLTCEDRFITLQPAQSLALLNSEFVHQQAARLAKSIEPQAIEDEEVVKKVILAVLSRKASEEEIENGTALIARLQSDFSVNRDRAVELYCLSILNWNEFLFLD